MNNKKIITPHFILLQQKNKFNIKVNTLVLQKKVLFSDFHSTDSLLKKTSLIPNQKEYYESFYKFKRELNLDEIKKLKKKKI